MEDFTVSNIVKTPINDTVHLPNCTFLKTSYTSADSGVGDSPTKQANLVFSKPQKMMLTPKNLPKLIVFDLDYTCWKFYVPQVMMRSNIDTSNRSYQSKVDQINFHLSEKEAMFIRENYKLFPEVLKVMEEIKNVYNIKIAIASRAQQTHKGYKLMELYGLDQFIDHDLLIHIYGGSKTAHFKRIKENYEKVYGQKIDYKDMVFFDDQDDNHEEISLLGVTGFNCSNHGVDLRALKLALMKYDDNIENSVEFPYNVVWNDAIYNQTNCLLLKSTYQTALDIIQEKKVSNCSDLQGVDLSSNQSQLIQIVLRLKGAYSETHPRLNKTNLHLELKDLCNSKLVSGKRSNPFRRLESKGVK